jgi:putative ABC transport system permease protein
MRIARNLRLSLRALLLHPARTALALAGTGLGVAGVLVVTAVGAGARSAVVRRIEGLGRNMLVVTAAPLTSRGGRTIEGEARRRLTREDAVAVLAAAGVVRAAPGQERGMLARFGPLQNPATVLGTTAEWRVIRRFPLAEGRFITRAENTARERVAVLGADTRRNLFPDSVSPLGRTIRIGRVPFRVVGVLAAKGVSADGNATEDDRIVIPLETALRRLFDQEYLKTVHLEVSNPDAMAAAAREVGAILRERHDLAPSDADDFVIQDQRVLLAAELATRASFRRLILGLGVMALLVGAVGNLSVLLLAIRERRAEIGLRTAVGARRRDVAVQFLAEAGLLAVLGGAVGIGVGVGMAELLAALTGWEVLVSGPALWAGLLAVALIALVGGVYPAWRAAALDPVEALRG